MAAILKFAPLYGAVTAGTTRRTNRSIVEALRREAQARPTLVLHRAYERPTLVCHWRQGADGRLSCCWDIEAPRATIIPN
jgi:hypothetical protein